MNGRLNISCWVTQYSHFSKFSVIVMTVHKVVVATFLDKGPKRGSVEFSVITGEIMNSEYPFL